MLVTRQANRNMLKMYVLININPASHLVGEVTRSEPLA